MTLITFITPRYSPNGDMDDVFLCVDGVSHSLGRLTDVLSIDVERLTFVQGFSHPDHNNLIIDALLKHPFSLHS